MTRRVTVSAVRLPGWIERFGERHGGCDVYPADDFALVISGGDGCHARIAPMVEPSAAGAGPTGDRVAWLAEPARFKRIPEPLLVVAIRRAGYAVAVTGADQVTASKHGRRHVQGRTAAGGWSQQRFARRRENASDALVKDVAEHVVRLVGVGGGRSRAVAIGGDRAMATDVLAAAGAVVAGLPIVGYLDVVDPDASFVRGLPELVSGVVVDIDEQKHSQP